MSIKKGVLPVVVGTMSGMALQVFAEKGVHIFYPLAEGADVNNATIIAEYMASLPVLAFVLLLLGFAISAAVAGSVATLINDDGSKAHALIVACILVLGTVFYSLSYPVYPVWFSVANVVLVIPFALVGWKMALRIKPASAKGD